MSFRISGLSAEPFRALFGLSDAELAECNVVRQVADADFGYPCRVTLADAKPGEKLLLLNYEHQSARTPYRARGPIFVREGAAETAAFTDEIPDYLARRTLSLRAYYAQGMMVDASVVDGREARPLIEKMLGGENVAYLHAHFAKRGCFAARIERA